MSVTMAKWRVIHLLFLLQIIYNVHIRAAQNCQKCSDYKGFHVVNYKSSDDLIQNPSRGFYQPSETKSSSFSPVTAGDLNNIRNSKRINLLFRMYVLDTFVHSPISSAFLHHIQTDMETVRSAGWNVVLRFSYTITQKSAAPYGDASKNVMLNHIKQLGPIWHKFEDVISVVQAGLIGTWGEWYYTTWFGDPQHPPSVNGIHGISAAHWKDRKDILTAMLNAMPKSMTTQLRTPLFKQQLFGSASSKSTDISNHTPIGRTGHHNDCFLKSETDSGTYTDVVKDKLYLAHDSMRVPVGGETCGRSSRSNCNTAVKEMVEFHWSFINSVYHPDVLNDWKTQGCYGNIEKKLGYRISLSKGEFPKTVQQGHTFCYRMTIKNEGFAAPYKTWNRIIAMHSKTTGKYYAMKTTDHQERLLIPSTVGHLTITGRIHVPNTVPVGAYDLYLGFTEEQAVQHADYYILMANENVPNAKTGLNNLHASLQVTHGTSTQHDNCPSVTHWSTPVQGRHARIVKVGSHAVQGIGCKKILVPNESFESDDSNWLKYSSGFQYSSDAFDGHRSIKVTNGGASHKFTFSSPITKFIFTGHSKYVGQEIPATPDYSVYCDVEKVDGSFLWGQNTPYSTKDSNWHKAALNVQVPGGMKSANCYVLYRNHNAGEAFFDKIELYELQDTTDFTTCNI